jgi:large subunit ribosomal protein L25
MKELNLTVEKRDGTGKGPNRRLRRDGEIPAVVYGPDTEPIPVKVNYKNLYCLMHNVPMNTIINLEITGDDSPARKVLIRELQKNPVTGSLVHLDFHHIPMDKPITLTVPVTAIGIPIGVKTFGGIVQHVRREIDISCLPTNIPDNIEVDISELNIGDSVHVSDLKLDNVNVLTNPSRTIVSIVAPTVIKSAAAEGEEAEGEKAAEGEEAAEGEAKEGDEKKEGGDKEKK